MMNSEPTVESNNNLGVNESISTRTINYTFLIHLFTELVLFSISIYFVYNKFSGVNERISQLEERIKVLEQKVSGGNSSQQILQHEQKMNEVFTFYKNELNKQGSNILSLSKLVPPPFFSTPIPVNVSLPIKPPTVAQKGFVQDMSDSEVDDDLDNVLAQELGELK